MPRKLSLICRGNRFNRYSFNALLGALETDPLLDDVTVILPADEKGFASAIGEALDKSDMVIAAFSFFTIHLWETAEEMRQLKERFHGKPFFIAGGPHPSGDPKGTLRMGFDLVVHGEGEEALKTLLRRLSEGEDWKSAPGIAFDDGGTVRINRRPPPVDLDLYPPFPMKRKRTGHIELTRGCPHGCHFCQTPQLMGGNTRHRRVETVASAVAEIKRQGRRHVRFITPDLFAYGSADGLSVRAEALEALLRRTRETIGSREEGARIYAGSFPSEVRPENVTPRMVSLVARYADNDNLVIGAQSGSPKVLERTRRGHTVEDVRRAVELTIRTGFKAYVDFIFGLPGEEEEDVELTLAEMKGLAELGAKIHAHTFMPLPGAPFARMPIALVSRRTREEIMRLTAHGSAFGQWTRQEKLAGKISDYLNGV